MKLNKVLQRQAKKYFSDEMIQDSTFAKFLLAISDSYDTFERERELIEHSFKMSETEFSELNHSLEKEVILKRLSIQKLKNAINKIDNSNPLTFSEDEDDILSILEYLTLQIEKRKQVEEKIIWQEEKYRNIIANMNLGLLEVDNSDIIQFANQSFCNMSGFTLEEIIGRKAANLVMTEEERELIALKNKNSTTENSEVYSLPIKNKKGEVRWWVVSGASRYNDKGELVGSVEVQLDITDQKRLEQELKIAKQKAEQSSKAKELFLATMSHEIRTPLNAIIGITDLMMSNSKARSKDNLDILSFSAKNLHALITDILDFTKIDTGKLEICKNPLDLKSLLNGIYHTFKATCEEKNVELIFDIDSLVPKFIIGDELRLSQILNNLLSNAVKFTPKGYVKLNLSTISSSKGDVELKFMISDTGIGIKKNKLNTIFNDFEQANSKIVRKYGGSGLGLSITKKLIEIHGGNITVESKLNLGSCFTFQLHYDVIEGIKKSIKKANKSGMKSQATIEDKLVLLVEDNIANQKVALSYLTKWGLKCEIANNGEEAMKMIKNKKYDLALIDLFMPIMDGFETIKHIRKIKKYKFLPLIALTASAENSLMDRALELGADKCLTKPFNAQNLHHSILELLKNDEKKENVIQSHLLIRNDNSEFSIINLKKIEDASLGSKFFILDMLNILQKEIPELLIEAEMRFENREYALFSKIIHKLKNNILMLGLDTIKEDLRFMEEKAPKEERLDEVQTAFIGLKNIWQKALSEIELARIKYN